MQNALEDFPDLWLWPQFKPGHPKGAQDEGFRSCCLNLLKTVRVLSLKSVIHDGEDQLIRSWNSSLAKNSVTLERERG